MGIDDIEYWDMLIKRSVSRFFLLSALCAGPMHGYELGRSIKETCAGCCEPSDAAIYPALRELLEGGYIDCRTESVGGRERKVCSLTDRGLQAYRVAAEAWSRVIPYLEKAAQLAEAAQQKTVSMEV